MKETFYFLKIKAGKFHKEAIYNFNNGDYDLCSFHLEQAVQLYLKFTLGIIGGDFPRTHDLNILLRGLSEMTDNKFISEWKVKRKRTIKKLEDSYFEARYFGTPFEKEDAEEMLQVTDELIKLLSPLWT